MMLINIFMAFLSTSALGVFADTLARSSSGCSRLLDGLSQLEQMYIQDCQNDPSPHGYYGAFLQPCEFSFFKSSEVTTTASSTDTFCSPDSLVGTRMPVHWLFELQEHIDKEDWDKLTSNDIPDWDDLMLWPDQCVGVAPRCYSIRDTSSVPGKSSTDVMKAVVRLLPDDVPDEATHVQVDCRSDALELSRVAFRVGNGLQKGLAGVIAMIIFAFLLIIVAMSLCCYGCIRLCLFPRHARDKMVPVYHVVPAESEFIINGSEKYLLKNEALGHSSLKHYQAVAV
jgi:hypothetical protein